MASHCITVPDLHLWYKSFKNRKNYLNECVTVYKLIKELTIEMRLKYPNDTIYIIFLGDIFHRGFENNPVLYNFWVQMFTVLRACCNGMYATMGNHEWTYKTDNPFWSLINSVDSMSLSNRGAKCCGILPVLNLQDHLDIEGFRLHFCHHNTDLYNIQDDGNNILFAHQYWMTDEMYSSLEALDSGKVQRKYMKYKRIDEHSILKKFRLGFFGHMHRYRGKFRIEWEDGVNSDTTLYHLGSLLLTNKDEVMNTGSERVIPIITLDNGVYSVEDRVIPIPNGIELLKYIEVEKAEKRYADLKVKKAAKEIKSIGDIDPLKVIEDDLLKMGSLESLDLFRSLEKGEMPGWLEMVI